MSLVPLVFSEQVQQEKVKAVWNIVQCLLSKSKDKFLGISGALQHGGSMYFFYVLYSGRALNHHTSLKELHLA